MPKDDISLKNVECPECNEVFDTPEGHLFGTCPTCDAEYWLDIIWEPGWGPPVDAAKLRKFKGIHSFGPSWYSVEWGEY